jgi:hypothetical protein
MKTPIHIVRTMTLLLPQNCKSRPPPTSLNGYDQEKTEPLMEEARWNHRIRQEKPGSPRLFTFLQEWVFQP